MDDMPESLDGFIRILGQLEAGIRNLEVSVNRIVDGQDTLRRDNDAGRARLHQRLDDHERDNAASFDIISKNLVTLSHVQDTLDTHGEALIDLEKRIDRQESIESNRMAQVNQNRKWIKGMMAILGLVEGTRLAKWIATLFQH